MSKQIDIVSSKNHCSKKRNVYAFILLSMFLLVTTPIMANDFPTQARAEFVFACMSTNGNTSEMLAKCSCAIDDIAENMTYEEYVDAETVLSMRLAPGDRTAMFKESAWAADIISRFNEIQVDADINCF